MCGRKIPIREVEGKLDRIGIFRTGLQREQLDVRSAGSPAQGISSRRYGCAHAGNAHRVPGPHQ